MTAIASHEWEELQKIVRAGAKEAVRKWPGVLDAEDIQQAVMLVLMESPATAHRLLDSEKPIQRRWAIKLAHREASAEMTDYEHFSGQFTYTTNQVRSVLESGVLTDDVKGFREEIVDLMDALEQMAWEKSAYVDPILKRYVDGEIPDNHNSTERSRLSRAVESLTEHMNRNNRNRKRQRHSEGGPGARRAITNSSASWVTKLEYEDDHSISDDRKANP